MVGKARVIAHAATEQALRQYRAQGYEVGLWSPKFSGYEILRPARMVGRKVAIPLALHESIRQQCALRRQLLEQARAINHEALAKRYGVSKTVISRIEAGNQPYKNFAPGQGKTEMTGLGAKL